jgi:hypothetical protein
MTGPSHPPRDDDEAVRQVVVGFAEVTDDPVPRGPVWEDLATLDDAEDEAPDALPRQSSEPLPAWLEPAPLEDEGHYTPPAPPRLPRIRLRTLFATVLMLAGFTILFLPFRVGLDDSPPSLLLGMALAGGGAALLVAGIRDDDEDRGPDGGAVV